MNTYSNEIQGVLAHARETGLEAEVYLRASTATTIRVQDGEVDQFTLADSRGAGIRVLRDGRTGYAYTEDLSLDALKRTLAAAATNAMLMPEGNGAELARFDGETIAMPLHRPELAAIPIPEKIAKAQEVERTAKSLDPRIKNVTGSALVAAANGDWGAAPAGAFEVAGSSSLCRAASSLGIWLESLLLRIWASSTSDTTWIPCRSGHADSASC